MEDLEGGNPVMMDEHGCYIMDEHGVPAYHPLLQEQHSLGAQFPVTFVLPV